MHRAGLPGSPRSPACSRRQVVVVDPRRTDRGRGRRVGGDRARHRRPLPHGDRAHALRRRARRCRRSHRGRGSMAGRSSSRSPRRSRPSASRPRVVWSAERSADSPMSWPPPQPPPCTVASALHTGIRNTRLVARRCGQCRSPGISIVPAERCSRCPPRAARRHGGPGHGEGFLTGTRSHACARAFPRCAASSRRGARRRDRDARRRPDARHGHHRRQPGDVDTRQSTARRRRSAGSTSW